MTEAVRPNLSGPDGEAFSFFRTFSRFEYALKAAGYLRQQDGRAEADWDGFSRSIGERLLEALQSPPFVASRNYLLRAPPRKQMVRDGRLYWDDEVIDDPCEAYVILRRVRRVRNNLFHGGKFAGNWFEPERSVELVFHSRLLLEACLSVAPDLTEAFEG